MTNCDKREGSAQEFWSIGNVPTGHYKNMHTNIILESSNHRYNTFSVPKICIAAISSSKKAFAFSEREKRMINQLLSLVYRCEIKCVIIINIWAIIRVQNHSWAFPVQPFMSSLGTIPAPVDDPEKLPLLANMLLHSNSWILHNLEHHKSSLLLLFAMNLENIAIIIKLVSM